MTIKISVDEVDALRKICALSNVKCHVFTWTAQYSQVLMTEQDGSELIAEDVWSICRSFTYELSLQETIPIKR